MSRSDAEEVLLSIDVASVRARSLGPTTGDIALKLGDTVFPAQGWNDFVVVVVGWWVVAVRRLVRRESTRERVPFMDGPHEVELTMAHGRELRLQAGSGLNRDRVAAGSVDLSVFADALIADASDLVACCERLGDSSDDVATLRRELALLVEARASSAEAPPEP